MLWPNTSSHTVETRDAKTMYAAWYKAWRQKQQARLHQADNLKAWPDQMAQPRARCTHVLKIDYSGHEGLQNTSSVNSGAFPVLTLSDIPLSFLNIQQTVEASELRSPFLFGWLACQWCWLVMCRVCYSSISCGQNPCHIFSSKCTKIKLIESVTTHEFHKLRYQATGRNKKARSWAQLLQSKAITSRILAHP